MIREALEVLATFKDEVTAPLRGMEQGVKGMGKDIETSFNSSLKNMAAGLAGFFALRSLTSFFADAVRGAAEEEQSMAALRVAIENTGTSYKEFGATAEAAVESQRKLTTFTDRDLRSALARLITATGDASGSTANLGLVSDIAAARHIDLSKAADVVAKAMEGNYTALKRIGIFIESGQDGIAVMRERFDGAAAAAANADSGLGRLAQSWDHFKDVIGENILKQQVVKDSLDSSRGSLETLGPAIGTAAGFFLQLLGSVAKGLGNWAEEFGLQVDSAKAFVQGFIGQFLVWDVELVTRMLGWIPVLGDSITAGMAATKAAGEGMVAESQTTFHNIEALQKESGEKVTSAAESYTTKIITSDKAQWDVHMATVRAGASTEVDENQGAKDKISAAQKKLNDILKLYYKTDAEGRVTITRQGQDAIEIAETNLAQAKMALTGMVSKKAEEAQAKIQKAEEDAAAALQRITNEFVKDFAGTVPSAVSALTKKVLELTQQADAWSKSTDPKIRAQADAVRALAAQYQAVVPVLTSLGTLSEAVAVTEKDPNRVRALQDLNDELSQAVTLWFQSGENTQAAAATEKLVLQISADITKEEQKQRDEAIKVQGAMHDQLPTLADLKREHDDILATQKAHRTAVANTAYEAIGLVHQFGLLDDNTAQALTDMVTIADEMSNLSTSTQGFTSNLSLANVGSLIGIVGTFGSLLGSLFSGESAESKAQKALMQRNNEALRALTDINGRLVLQNDTGQQIQGFKSMATDDGPYGNMLTRKAVNGRISVASLAGDLAAFGLTPEMMRNLAKTMGIDLGEKDGSFSLEGVRAFVSGINDLNPQVFAESFAGRQSAHQAERTARGTDTPDQIVTDLGEDLYNSGSMWLEQFLGSFDLTTPEGRKAARTAVADLIRQMSFGAFDMSLLGGLTSGEFTGALSTFIGAISTMESAPAPTPPVDTSSAPQPETPAPPKQTKTPTATYTPATGSTGYVPSDVTGVSLDLSPVVSAITDGFAVANAHLEAIEANTAATADSLAGGGLLQTISTGLARAASLSGVNSGVSI